jgi:hypothetical protein
MSELSTDESKRRLVSYEVHPSVFSKRFLTTSITSHKFDSTVSFICSKLSENSVPGE